MTIAAASAATAAYRIVLRSTTAAAPGTMAGLLGSRHAAGSAPPQLTRQPPALAGYVRMRLVHGSSRGGLACMGYGSHQSDNDPEIIKKEKKKALTGCSPEFVPELPGWNEKLATDSEAVIKAERTPDMPIEAFQEFTIEAVRELEATDQGQCSVTPPVIPAKAPDVQKDLEYDDDPNTMGIKPL